jgi:acyl-CoA thioester hydrolase
MAYEFRYRRMVQWVDTDVAGIIHFSNYFRYMEEIEIAFYRSLGFNLRAPSEHEILRPRVSASCDFKKPVTFGDFLDIHLWITRKGRSSVSYEISFCCEGEEVARGKLVVACVRRNQAGQLESTPIPEDWARALELAPGAVSPEA